MSKTLSIAQINPIVGSFKQNLQMIAKAINSVKHDNADVIIFPLLNEYKRRQSTSGIRITKRVFGKHRRRYPITSHCRWN